MESEIREVRADDQQLTWLGAVEVEHTPDWSRGWRLPQSRIDLFPGDLLQERATPQAGIRVRFGTDAQRIGGKLLLGTSEPGLSRVAQVRAVDLVVDGGEPETAPVDADGTFWFTPRTGADRVLEVWLPQAGDARLERLFVDEPARTWSAPRRERPQLITYGSSITHCYEATSPTQTWPALVSNELGLDLTCLGFSGQCHLDPMIGRLIRDLPADVITTCLGINVWGSGVFNQRSFLPAVLGLLSTIRDGHPDTPMLVITPISCPERDDTPGDSGMTLAEIRAQVAEAVRLLGTHGDSSISVLHGPEVLGPHETHHLHDGVHPDAAGYALMASRIAPVVEGLVSTGSTNVRSFSRREGDGATAAGAPPAFG